MPLTLTREPYESIIIGGNITITVVQVRGDKVRLAIDAPRDVRIDRAEVHELRKQQGKTGPSMTLGEEDLLRMACTSGPARTMPVG